MNNKSRPFANDVLFFQRLLKSEGFYRGRLDGLYGRYTEMASITFQTESKQLVERYGVFDRRTERNIKMMTLRAQVLARQFMARMVSAGINGKIISGTRTYADQNKLYAKGRTAGHYGKTVTNARGGQSEHNFGKAWDIALFDKRGRYLTTRQPYVDAHKHLADDALVWGGNWTSIIDVSHYQVRTIYTLAGVRSRFETGRKYIA